MISSLLFLALFSTVHCGVVEDVLAYIEHEEYFEFFCLQEQSEVAMEDFFIRYPTLQPSNRADIVMLKRSFVKFLDLDPMELQLELISGATTEHNVLSQFIEGLKEFAREEFKNLSARDRSYLGSINEYVQHKLINEHGLKLIRQKKDEYLESGLSKQEFAADVMLKCGIISHKWNMDPAMELDESLNDPEFEKELGDALRAWEEKKEQGEDESIVIHIDGQTNEKKIKTVKLTEEEL